jgi:hypothetical protein
MKRKNYNPPNSFRERLRDICGQPVSPAQAETTGVHDGGADEQVRGGVRVAGEPRHRGEDLGHDPHVAHEAAPSQAG